MHCGSLEAASKQFVVCVVEKIFSTLPPAMKALLDQCVSRGLYGDQAATIRHFVTVGLERLVDQHRLFDIPTAPIQPQKAQNDGEAGEG